jgi:hypothetical protein
LLFSVSSDACSTADVGALGDADIAGGSPADGELSGDGGFGGSSRLTSAERNAGERCAYRIVIYMDV